MPKNKITPKKVKEFKGEIGRMLDEWSPEEFAAELYGNPYLENESRTIMTIYLSRKPESFRNEVYVLGDEYL